MPDIAKCANEECIKKEKCYRYTCPPSYPQYYILPIEMGDACEYFIDNAAMEKQKKMYNQFNFNKTTIEAIQDMLRMGNISEAYLQNKLKIDFKKAKRICDMAREGKWTQKICLKKFNYYLLRR